VLPHTADLIIEAWAPSRVRCLREAVQALVESFARIPEGATGRRIPIALAPGPDDAVLVALLEEVIFALEVQDGVCVDVELSEVGSGLSGWIRVAPLETVEVFGPAPKGVSWGGLTFGRDDRGWRCRATVDV
jgi:SHS2 domain-containing protein